MQPTIRSNLLAPILEPLAARGYDTTAILRRHALPATQPIDPYQIVPLARYVALFEHAAALLQHKFLGLKLGHNFRPELLGPLGFLFRAGISPDRAMAPFMEHPLHDLARDLARESREARSLSRQVSHLIAGRIGLGPLSLPAIAAELGLPARSLQRPLAGEHTTFRKLVRDHATTVTSIAHTVGYAETAVLSRAFKRWTGTSPTTFARANRGCH